MLNVIYQYKNLNTIKTLLIFVLLISLVSNLNATVYYISNSGDDSNNGISPVYPIQSIAKLNTLIFKLQPGDAVLFERGSVFYGQINMNLTGGNDKPIVFGAYGKGTNPVISGSVPVGNWSKYKRNIYKAEVNGIVKNLFANENQMILARYPNSGYLRIDRPYADSKAGFTDNDIKQTDGYWKDSYVRIRTENWTYENTPVEYSKSGSLSFENKTFYPVKTGWGYYLDNNINLLDTEGEWYFEKNKSGGGTIYFYAYGGQDPNNLNVQATVSDCAFFSLNEFTNITFQDLKFRNNYLAGIYLANRRSNLRIRNCTFTGQFLWGLYIPTLSENITIENCRFYNINGQALFMLNTKNSVISKNIFKNIGMIPGYGTTGDPFPMSAVIIFGDNNTVAGNYIEQIGHDGINSLGKNNIVEKNIVKNCLLLLNDGGAIKCYGKESTDSFWRNNFIFNVTGNTESTDDSNGQIIALGFYLDELANNMKISNNTISGCSFAGIGTNAGFENTFENNVSYSNSIGVSFYQNEILCKNNSFYNNVLFGTNEYQVAILNQSLYRSNVPGRFEDNYYYNPSEYNIFRIIENNIITDFNFDKWKRFVKSDNNSNILVNKEISNSKLFSNMSDDSLKVLLSSEFNFRDLNMNSVFGTLTINPWSSVILLSDSKVDNLAEITTGGGSLDFEKLNESDKGSPLWYNLMGSNLKTPVIITATEGFQIGLNDDSNFSGTITLKPENGKVNNIIFVKFVPDDSRRYYGFISNKSGNIEHNVKVNGDSK